MGWKDWAIFIAIVAGVRGLHWVVGVPWRDWNITVVLILASMVVIVNAIRKDVG